MWSVATFDRLEREGEIRPGWRRTGSLRLAQTPERVEEFARLLAVAREAGLEAELIDADAARRLWPKLDFAAARAILWCPSDGYLQPADLVASYRHHAARKGVRFRTDTRVTGIRLSGGRVAAVETDQPKDQLHASCWDRYREYLVGDKPKSFEEKPSADNACRLIVCPTCPR